MLFSSFLAAFGICVALVPGIMWLMKKWKVVDQPKIAKRKIHSKPIPLGGGLAVFLSFFLVMFGALFFTDSLNHKIGIIQLVSLFLASMVLIVGGIVDDRYDLSPKFQLIFPLIATFLILVSGIHLESITNPFGGSFPLTNFSIPLGHWSNWMILADSLLFVWIMGLMFTTKVLDGLDGLVTGIIFIGAMLIMLLSLQPQWYQYEVALLSAIFAGSCLGFLVYNFHPAKIFLGQGGSMFTGFLLAILAILSDGKIAVTLLVMAVPVLDVLRVITRRWQKKKPLFVGDNEHLHFRLLKSGLSHRQTVLLFYSISFLFGMSAFFLQSHEKFIALSFLFLLMLLIGIWFSRQDARNRG